MVRRTSQIVVLSASARPQRTVAHLFCAASVLQPCVADKRGEPPAAFAHGGLTIIESGRALAAVARREGWQLLDENPSLLNDALIAASWREQGITLITRDGDFNRLAPFVKGFRHAAPWPMAAGAMSSIPREALNTRASNPA